MLNVDTLEATRKEPPRPPQSPSGLERTKAYNNLNEVHSSNDGLTHCWRIAFKEDHPGGVKNFRVQTSNIELAAKLRGRKTIEMVGCGINYFEQIFAVRSANIDHIIKIAGLPKRRINPKKTETGKRLSETSKKHRFLR